MASGTSWGAGVCSPAPIRLVWDPPLESFPRHRLPLETLIPAQLCLPRSPGSVFFVPLPALTGSFCPLMGTEGAINKHL